MNSTRHKRINFGTSEPAYKPKYPETHKLLLEIYKNGMDAGSKNSKEWCDRFKALYKTLVALKTDGDLSLHFIRNFWVDIKNIQQTVPVKVRELDNHQSHLKLGMISLKWQFGG